MPRVSILDTVPVGPGDELPNVLRRTTEVAQLAEQLGFHRMWVAEHHATGESGCGVPAVLLAHIASVVHRLRLGAGGVMLPNHAPLVVAEEFRMLEALFPGRIDVGVGRAKGIEEHLLGALRRAADNKEAFREQICELRGFLAGRFDVGHRFDDLSMPALSTPPPIYVLGSSVSSACLAGALGLPFAYAHFQNPLDAATAMSTYRGCFAGSQTEPYTILSVRVVGREEAAAASLAALWATVVRMRKTAARRADLTIDDSILLHPELSDRESDLAYSHLAQSSVFVGDSQGLRSQLSTLAAELNLDELMILPIEFDLPGRLATMRTVARDAPFIAVQELG